MISRMTRRGMLTLLGLWLALVTPVAGQRATLERVEELVRMGRTDEARSGLLEWWDGGREDASRRELQRGLWLRGRLTVDPVQAELDFQRLAVLYPRGPFTPQAIFRLAQVAHEMGDEEEARGHVATLVRDHANSPAREEAEAWLRATGPAPLPPDAPAGAAAATTNPAAEEREPAPAEENPEAEDAPPRVGNYFVQLGAFAEEGRAMALYQEVREAGIDVRVVRLVGSGFLHVRFGRFVERADAVEELERLTAAGISAALVRDERGEQLVRD